MTDEQNYTEIVLALNSVIWRGQALLEQIELVNLDENQSGPVRHLNELLGEASSAAGYLIDVLDAWHLVPTEACPFCSGDSGHSSP